MAPISVGVLLLFSIQFLSSSAGGPPADPVSQLSQAYTTFYACVIQCYRDSFRVNCTGDNPCTEKPHISCEPGQKFNFRQVKKSFYCITKGCNSQVPKYLCDSTPMDNCDDDGKNNKGQPKHSHKNIKSNIKSASATSTAGSQSNAETYNYRSSQKANYRRKHVGRNDDRNNNNEQIEYRRTNQKTNAQSSAGSQSVAQTYNGKANNGNDDDDCDDCDDCADNECCDDGDCDDDCDNNSNDGDDDCECNDDDGGDHDDNGDCENDCDNGKCDFYCENGGDDCNDDDGGDHDDNGDCEDDCDKGNCKFYCENNGDNDNCDNHGSSGNTGGSSANSGGGSYGNSWAGSDANSGSGSYANSGSGSYANSGDSRSSGNDGVPISNGKTRYNTLYLPWVNMGNRVAQPGIPSHFVPNSPSNFPWITYSQNLPKTDGSSMQNARSYVSPNTPLFLDQSKMLNYNNRYNTNPLNVKSATFYHQIPKNQNEQLQGKNTESIQKIANPLNPPNNGQPNNYQDGFHLVYPGAPYGSFKGPIPGPGAQSHPENYFYQGATDNGQSRYGVQNAAHSDAIASSNTFSSANSGSNNPTWPQQRGQYPNGDNIESTIHKDGIIENK